MVVACSTNTSLLTAFRQRQMIYVLFLLMDYVASSPIRVPETTPTRWINPLLFFFQNRVFIQIITTFCYHIHTMF